jgi:hypothetical protein
MGRVSQSGHGVHLRDREVFPGDVPLNEYHRRMAGDDLKRIRGDEREDLHGRQILWSSGHVWHESVDELIREYEQTCNLTPAQHEYRYER